MSASVQILNICAQPARLHGFSRQNKYSINTNHKRRLSVVRANQEQNNNNNYRGESTIDKNNNNNNNKKKLKVLIAGGGIAGLVFALAAKRSGFDVTVFEKDVTVVRGEGDERGPIQLLSSALGLLENVDKDVVTEISEAGYVTGDRPNGLADGTTGNWFAKFDFLTPALQKGIPVTQIICRAQLQRILLNAVGEDLVVNNSRVVDFVDHPNKVTALLENGEKYEGDVLVGADGIRSIVRSKLFGPNKEAKYSSFICYTGVAEFPPTQAPPPFGYKIFIGRSKYFVALDIGKGRMQWYAFEKEERRDTRVSSAAAGNKKQLLETYGDWCDEVNGIIVNTEEQMIIRRPIYDIDMLNTWGKGRVILLGDAAHAMLPNLGQGGSMAIEDCYWLVCELRYLAERNWPLSWDELAVAFRRYEKKRMFRVSTVHAVSRIASVLTSFYSTHFNIPPLPFFNLSAMRVKHPSFVVSNTLLKFVLPKFMDWVVVGQE